MKAETIAWSKLELKNPVSFRDDGKPFIIRHLQKVKGRIMCKCEMDDDSLMRPFDFLPADVQKVIQSRIAATA